ncbi:chitinase [Arthrobacter sulfonylureivorans]|uniref:chitinase n=1 Tax=Arthrobacter sulfonylureivorans TaxID=2486855 RepID=UPI0039E5110E
MSKRFPGRRLSWLRLGVLITATAALVAAAGVGWGQFTDARAAAGKASWFAGYVDATATPFYSFENPSSEAERSVILSFIVADPENPCTPSWGGFYGFDEAQATMDLDRRVARLAETGGHVGISFGGLLNLELASACTDPVALKRAYSQVLERYTVDTIDLDIEGENLTDVTAGERRATVMAQLAAEREAAGQDLEIWLTLPVAPHGLTEDGVRTVQQMLAAKVPLAGVNLMTMDYGQSRQQDQTMLDASIQAARSAHVQLQTAYREAGLESGERTVWSKIGLTPMIGQNDVPGEIFTVDDAAGLNAFATEVGVGRMSMWSLNRDTTCSTNYGDVTKVSDSCSGVEQQGISYAAVLGQNLGGLPRSVSEPGHDATAAPAPTGPPTASDADIVDDPATSPYPIWTSEAAYVANERVVWHRNVYKAKWWTRGDVPDDPTASEDVTPWTLIGPVLPGETPQPVVTAPAGTFPEWKIGTVYLKTDRVQLEGRVFEAKWWTQGDSPEAALQGADGSPWLVLTNEEVAALLADLGK